MSGIGIIMQKECKLLELQITLCKHPKGGAEIIMSKFNSSKMYYSKNVVHH